MYYMTCVSLVYTYIYICTYKLATHVYMHTYIYICIHICAYVYMPSRPLQIWTAALSASLKGSTPLDSYPGLGGNPSHRAAWLVDLVLARASAASLWPAPGGVRQLGSGNTCGDGLMMEPILDRFPAVEFFEIWW